MIAFEPFAASTAQGVRLTGRLDSAGVEQIESDLAAHVDAGNGPVLFDLAAVTFVGSLGIRLLVAASRRLGKQGRALALFGVQPQVAEVFETVALSDLIPIAADAVAALQAVEGA